MTATSTELSSDTTAVSLLSKTNVGGDITSDVTGNTSQLDTDGTRLVLPLVLSPDGVVAPLLSCRGSVP